MLSVITLFYMKRVSFAIAMAVVLLIVGELCFTLGVARMAKYLFSPSGLYIYFLPISLAVYTGILYFKNELS